MKSMKKFLFAALIAVAVASVAPAATVTNSIGQVMTVTKLSETMAAGTVDVDRSGMVSDVGRVGVIVAHYKFAAGDTSPIEISKVTVPKGAILLGTRVVQVTTGLTSITNCAITCGGVTVLAAGADLATAGIVASTTPVMTTSAGKVVLTTTGFAQTNGEFTVHIPYVMGTAQ